MATSETQQEQRSQCYAEGAAPTDPKSFIWKATAEDIIEKVQRGRATLTRQTNTKTDHEQAMNRAAKQSPQARWSLWATAWKKVAYSSTTATARVA